MDFTQYSCQEFVTALASKAPVPGGGGASALVGAIGTALGSMVGNLTTGKKKYADVESDIKKLMEQAERIQSELLSLVEQDALVFEPLSKAYSLPKNTEEEKTHKARIMEAALKSACEVPVKIMEKCCEAIELHEEFGKKGSIIAISDVGVGVICLKSALMGASLNVFINTKSMTDREYAESVHIKVNHMLEKYTQLADNIYADVRSRFY